MLFIIPTVNTHWATLVPDNQLKNIFYFTINDKTEFDVE